MDKGYYTIGTASSWEIVINKSRFIAECFQVSSEDEVSRVIETIRERHPDASHHCYACIIGRDAGIQRFSDDGEPGGTAGMPILQVLQHQELRDTLVVVTRYFGGTKLGAGGLVRAYSKAAAEGLQRAGKVEMIPSSKGYISIEYSYWGSVEYFIKQNEETVHIVEVQYGEKVNVYIITSMKWDNLSKAVAQLCSGRAECKEQERVFYSWKQE